MKSRRQRSTPPGQHLPVLLDQVLRALAPQAGEIVVDCTVGWAGHSVELLKRIGPTGWLIGMDFDQDNLPHAISRLEQVGFPFAVHQGNFAGLQTVLASEQVEAVDVLLADLGMSSMQVDDPERGFSYARDGVLDMRMDRSRGRTASQILASIAETQLRDALRELGDEPQAERIAAAIVAARAEGPIERTGELAQIIMKATGSAAAARGWRLHPAPNRWTIHPAARSFQAIRLLVNRELDNLQHLLRILPQILRPGGRAGIISFHSGEDRLVKAAFRDGHRLGIYEEISGDPLRASEQEKFNNPRSRSAKLRWARRSGQQ